MFPRKVTRLDLFSGISLGLHWVGIQTVALCKAEPCSRATLRASGMPRPDVLCGGFPCRDINLVGCGAGLAGARSGLWSHMARLVAECRPRWVVVEKLPGLRGWGADQVLADVAALGYAGGPCVVGAAHTGAPYRRARVWIVAEAISLRADGPGLEGWVRGPAQPPSVLPAERRSGWPLAPGL